VARRKGALRTRSAVNHALWGSTGWVVLQFRPEIVFVSSDI
jgi:hypothetical protein